jgi:hypothetical protein
MRFCLVSYQARAPLLLLVDCLVVSARPQGGDRSF